MISILLFAAVLQVSASDIPDVQRWHPTDIVLQSNETYDNPFMDVAVYAELTGPDEQKLRVPGFYDGDGRWIVRVSLPVVGNWTYITSSSDDQLNDVRGELRCIPNTNANIRGRIRVDPERPHHFVYENGNHYFMMGFECDWLAHQDLGTDDIPLARKIIDMYADSGFSAVIMNVYAHDTLWRTGKTSDEDYGPPALYAWEGTNDEPDHSRMNPEYFKTFDRVMDYLMQRGVTAHIFLKVYNKLVKWPPRGTPENDLYFRYVVSRYQAYPNVIWDFSKEAYHELDKDYIIDRLEFIRATDAYDHLVTVHDMTVHGNNFYVDPERHKYVDFHTDQHHSDFYNTIITQREARDWPIYNSEYGYEWGKGGPEDKTFGAVQSPDEVFWRTCEVIMAGGYPAYYYTNHAWDVIKADERPDSFDWYANLAEFFRSTRWYDLEPRDDLLENSPDAHVLADRGREYIVYIPGTHWAILHLDENASEKSLNVRWMNTRTGEEQTQQMNFSENVRLDNPWFGTIAFAHILME